MLARGRSRTIGMIVSNLQNPFFVDIFRSLSNAALHKGYSVVVEDTGYQPARLVTSIRTMLGMNLCGLAAIVSEMEAGVLEELSGRDLPVVIYDVGRPSGNITSMKVRYEIGMQRTVEYLSSLGHRRMAFVGHHASLSPIGARRTTFVETMKRFASTAEFTTVENTDSPAGGRDAARGLLSSGFAPTAILCVNDFMAIGVLKELRDRGLNVPKDVSVTGFDNVHLAEFTIPALTTVNVPRSRIGQLCFDALVHEQGQGFPPDRNILIDPELVVRESTGPTNAQAVRTTALTKRRKTVPVNH
jgi:LacI family transcriptional regulator